MKGSRLILICSFVLIVVIPITYYAMAYDGRFKALSPEETLEEYRIEAESLTLAPGWEWPESPVLSKAPDGNDIMYERGWGKQEADFYWFCSWISRTIDPQLSKTEQQKALKNVLSIRTKYFYTTALADESKPFFDQMLQKASDGNMEDLKEYYELNCSKAP